MSLVYYEGVSLTEGSIKGIGAARNSVGVFGASTESRTQTMMSAIANPPEKQKMGLAAACMLAGSVIAMIASSVPGSIVGYAIVGLSGWAMYRVFQYNATRYPALLADWNKVFMCQRCGAKVLVHGLESP
jgi:hypothetical protein